MELVEDVKNNRLFNIEKCACVHQSDFLFFFYSLVFYLKSFLLGLKTKKNLKQVLQLSGGQTLIFLLLFLMLWSNGTWDQLIDLK